MNKVTVKLGKCKGCGSSCAVDRCDVCQGRQVCQRCQTSGKQIIQGRVVQHGQLVDSVVPESHYNTTYRM